MIDKILRICYDVHQLIDCIICYLRKTGSVLGRVGNIALDVSPPPSTARSRTVQAPGFATDFLAGLRLVRASRVLLTVLVTVVVFMLGGALNTMSIFFVQQNLHASPAQFGLLGAAEGIFALGAGRHIRPVRLRGISLQPATPAPAAQVPAGPEAVVRY
jgi:hypothetical protein